MNRYLIQEFSDKSGISPDTLRYYEKRGMLHPERNEDNDYRSYDDYDLIELTHLRIQRGFDVSIRELTPEGHPHSLSWTRSFLNSELDNLKKNVSDAQKKLNRVRNYMESLDLYSHGFDSFQKVVCPPSWFLPLDEDRDRELIALWASQLPTSFLSFRFPASQLYSGRVLNLNAEPGYAIMLDNTEGLNFSRNPPAIITPETSGMLCRLSLSDPFHPRVSEFAPILEYLKKRREVAVGLIRCRLLFIDRDSGTTQYFMPCFFETESE